MMYTLFIDTHKDCIIIVLYQENQIIIKKEIETKQNHSNATMPVLVESLEQAGIDVQDIKEILVVNGPGSFTGVRIGVTIAKTLAYTLQIPIKTITSLLLKAVSFSHEEVNIIEKEKNGVFIGTFNQNNDLIKPYYYLKTSEYHKQEMDVEDIEIDYERVLQYMKTLEPINPHAVNPLYVKQIEVQNG